MQEHTEQQHGSHPVESIQLLLYSFLNVILTYCNIRAWMHGLLFHPVSESLHKHPYQASVYVYAPYIKKTM